MIERLSNMISEAVARVMDRPRRLRETDIRVEHADRMMSNAMDNLDASSKRLKDTVHDDAMIKAVRQLSAVMDKR